jgi:hypothetical protein
MVRRHVAGNPLLSEMLTATAMARYESEIAGGGAIRIRAMVISSGVQFWLAGFH